MSIPGFPHLWPPGFYKVSNHITAINRNTTEKRMVFFTTLFISTTVVFFLTNQPTFLKLFTVRTGHQEKTLRLLLQLVLFTG